MEQKKRAPLALRLWRALYSMRLAIILLLAIIAACTLGGVIPQGEAEAYYLSAYGGFWSEVILFLQLDGVFTCFWFVGLTGLLCLNLLLCSILRFPQILRRFRGGCSLEQRLALGDATAEAPAPEDLEGLFQRMGFRRALVIEREDRKWRYGVKNRMGLWGSWLTHLGLLMVILGFALGQALSFESTVYGVAGQEKPVGDGRYSIAIDDFQLRFREDGSIEQYISQLTVKDGQTGAQLSGTSQVNAPLSAFGMRIYQNSIGWAANVDIYMEDALIGSEPLCLGESLRALDGRLTLVFMGFYPELGFGENGMPLSLSSRLANPYALFALYYDGAMVDMNLSAIGSPIRVDDLQFVFEDPRHYTLLQVVKDPTMGFVALGAAVLLLGLFAAFYMGTEELWTDGVTAWGKSPKGRGLFAERLREAAGSKNKIREDGGEKL